MFGCNILDMVDVIVMKKAEFWGTFALAVALPGDVLRVWEFFARHFELFQMRASSIHLDVDVQGKAIMYLSGKRNADI